jgi:hypothetical protein
MEELKRAYHKKRKWVCPSCGRVKMQVKSEKTKGKIKKAWHPE